MTIREFSLVRFGGMADKRMDFTEGVNVVLGPNESGKSTLMAAIAHCLLTPVSLSKAKFRDLLGKRWLPASGGDTLKLEMVFSAGDRRGTLVKQWGAAPVASLEIEGSGIFTLDEEIFGHIESFCGTGIGTIRNVLLARQNGLAVTLEQLRREGDSLGRLSDILRKTLLQTDGVSVTRFMSRLEEMHANYFSHWDRARNRPEADRSGRERGVAKPWSREVGIILEAWYRYKKSVSDFEAAKEAEDAEVKVQKELETLRRETEDLREFLDGNRTAFQDAGNRKALELEVKNAEGTINILREAQREWNRSQIELEGIGAELPGLQEELGKRKSEMERARLQLENKAAVERYRRCLRIQERIESLRGELKNGKNLPEKEYRRLEELSLRIPALEQALKAGRLHAQVRAKKNIQFFVASGMGDEEKRDLLSGSSARFDAAGKIHFHTDEWEIEVFSGEGEFEKTESDYRALRDEYRKLCSAMEVKDLTEARKFYLDRNRLKSELEAAEKQLQDETGEEDFSLLQRRVGQLTKTAEDIRLSDIQESYTALQGKIGKLTDRKESLLKRVDELAKKYRTEDDLINELGKAKAEEQKLKGKFDESSGLPEGYDGADDFMTDFREKERKLRELQEEIHRLQIRAVEMEKKTSDISSDELETLADRTKEEFGKALRRGEALEKILAASRNILEEAEKDPYGAFYRKVGEYLSLLTGGRYSSLHMDKPGTALPDGILTEEGFPLPFDLLSAGTQDVFALAVRLSMAEYLVSSGEGVMILDDPLVDMDPSRQELAARCIEKFSKNNQCIIFTCHPGQADLFSGANIIEL